MVLALLYTYTLDELCLVFGYGWSGMVWDGLGWSGMDGLRWMGWMDGLLHITLLALLELAGWLDGWMAGWLDRMGVVGDDARKLAAVLYVQESGREIWNLTGSMVSIPRHRTQQQGLEMLRVDGRL